MKWETHRRITREVARGCGIGMENELAEASILPDKDPEYELRVGRGGRVYEARVRHHGASKGLIMRHVWRARNAYLRGDVGKAVEEAGRALHYVQDSCVSKLSKLWIFQFESERAHERREDELARVKPSFDAIMRGMKTPPSPRSIERAVSSIVPRSSPQEIMDEACEKSASVLHPIFCPKSAPEGLVDEFRRKLRIHVKTYFLAAIIAGFLTILLLKELGIVLGPALAYIIMHLDRKYYELSEDARWYGIRRSRVRELISIIWNKLRVKRPSPS